MRCYGNMCGHGHVTTSCYYRLNRLEEGEGEEPPMEFDGGFKVPSGIWNKLYRLVGWVVDPLS